MRAATSDEDWINSVAITDDEWINSMEQMGLGVGKYMKAESLPQFTWEINRESLCKRFRCSGSPRVDQGCKEELC
jgi:hypothetical protein